MNNYVTLEIDRGGVVMPTMKPDRELRSIEEYGVDIVISETEAQRAIDEIRSEAKDFPEMSLDEINAEINAVRSKNS